MSEAALNANAEQLKFVHLRCHSAYSLLEGALQIGKLIKLAQEHEMPALGLVDNCNLFGALEFSEKASSAGLQPIVGCQIGVSFDESSDEDNPFEKSNQNETDIPHLVLIAMNERGYENLVVLNSRAYLDTEAGLTPHVSWDLVRQHTEGLICLTGGRGGPLNKAIADKHYPEALRILKELKQVFDDRLYIELHRVDMPEEGATEPKLVDFAYDNDIALAATNEPFFASSGDFEAHDALCCIAQGTVIAADDRVQLTDQCYFRSAEEMAELFSDIPEAIENTAIIAQRCSYRPLKRDPILPTFTESDDPAVDTVSAEAAELRRQAEEGLRARLDFHGTAHDLTEEVYAERLDYELSIIEQMKFPGYFLIVADFIKWAKNHDIPVGPGRGSGAGSLVAWALTVTDLDPLRFSLLFERFLNPERVSMPDFDIDFCQDRRDEVIRYVQERYGRDQVAQIITFGTLQARAVLRDVGRVLQMPYGQVDRLCKLVPANPANPVTLAEAVDGEPKLQEARKEEEIVDTLISTSLKLEGLFRHASTHAAGIVIGDRPLEQLVPLYRDPRSDMPVTQFNMKWVENAGLVKFDFLGLKTLTVLQKAVDLLKKRDVHIDLAALPLDDKKTYDMLSRGESVGVFQLESMGMRKALVGMRPDVFEDIIALVALYRPGPMDNIPTYNARKHGEEEPDYIHPKIEKFLIETQGVIIYQEQVMQIAQELSGYSLGEADLLRRAMGKKIREEMEKQRVRFVDGAVERGVKKAKANEIFDLLAKFANYGFNKSHAAAYALVAYQTAYLKANYPVEFLAASMTLDMGNTDKLSDFVREARRLKFNVHPPSVNKSDVEFDVEGDTIFYSLAAIKGVGEGAAESVVNARKSGTFASLADFGGRIDPKSLNKRTLERLVEAGAFDELISNRAQVLGSLEQVSALANRKQEEAASGQDDMFAASGEPEPIRLKQVDDWEPTEKLGREQNAIGFYLSAHPLDQYSGLLDKMNVKRWAGFEQDVKAGATVGKIAGTVLSKQERTTRTGNKMGILRISDPTGQFEAVMFSETLNQFREIVEAGSNVVLMVGAEDRPEGVNVRISHVEPLDKVAANFQGALQVFVRDTSPLEALRNQLQPGANGRGSQVSFIVLDDKGQREVEVRLRERYTMSPKIAGSLKAINGVIDTVLQ